MSIGAALERLAPELGSSLRSDEPLARHTTYRIGGPAAIWVEAASLGQLARAVEVCTEESVEWTVLGKGSNVLAADDGYDGAVIVLGVQFRKHEVDGDKIRTGAGVPLAVLVQDAFSRGLSGFEFAVGIPGTVGGALAMNAGSSDEWIGEIVDRVTVLSPTRGLVEYGASEVRWDYRRSDLQQRGIIIESVLRLEPGDANRIRRVMEASLSRRKRSQPVGRPSAGSVFRNPEGDSAGRLIEAVGLKGTAVGNAVISDVHANFIVNAGGATARDVLSLIGLARRRVEEVYGIRLQPEIKFLGSFPES